MQRRSVNKSAKVVLIRDIPPSAVNGRIFVVVSFRGLRSRPLAEPHAHTAAVLVSELDAGGLERPLNHRKGCLTRFRGFALK